MTARTWTRRSLPAGGLAVAVTACSSGGSTDEGGSDADARPSGATDGRPPSEPAAPGESTSFTAADFDDLGACQLTPEQTAGPFPLDEQFDRRDITEGSPGTPLRLGFRVVDEACAAIAGAAVEVWHADATGDYSAFTDNGGGKDEAEGTTFLRGTQTAGDDGIVEFATIYPGWYTGRASTSTSACTSAAESCSPARCTSTRCSPRPCTRMRPTPSSARPTPRGTTTASPVTRGRRHRADARARRRRGDRPAQPERAGLTREPAQEAGQPTEPSIWSSMRRDHSTAYSIGRVLVTGSMKPLTTMPMAWSSDSPRLIR